MANFLAGKPINIESTLGAAEAVFAQWMGGMGADYHPDVVDGESEGHAHRRAQRGPWAPPGWTGGIGGTPGVGQGPRQGPQGPPRRDPAAAARQARKILGFGPTEPITKEDVDKRRRKLARKYHPDLQGGSEEKMIAVNRAADFLVVALEHGL